jgi:formylglycine-generating enzyme required for sulfatase activity
LKKYIAFLNLMLGLLVSSSIFSQTTAKKQEEILLPESDKKVKLVYLPEGTFMMGSNTSTKPNEKPAKKVHVSAFAIGAFEITHDQFNVFYRDENTSQGSKVDAVTRPTAQYIDLSWNMGKDGGYPVNSMSVDAAMMFCRWLYSKTGVFYRLPTEAEWEYACRAGSKTSYFFGNDPAMLTQYAWFKNNSKEKYQKIGTKKPNAWGLYDMIGNVAEWTMDQYDPEYLSKLGDSTSNPTVAPSKRYPRSIRGGSYVDNAASLKVFSRQFSDVEWNKRDPQIPKSRWWLTDGAFAGFRIVKPNLQPTAEEAEKFYKLYLGN